MKKIALVLLICIYTLSSFGVGVRQFYCCGKLQTTTISIFPSAIEKCGKGYENNGCCKIKYKSLEVKDNHIAANDNSNMRKQFTSLTLFTPSFEESAYSNKPIGITNLCNAPPAQHGIPVYILNCNFRI